MSDTTEERGFGELTEREVPDDTESTDEQSETDSNEDQDTESKQTDNQQGEEENKDQTEEDVTQDSKEEELTENGTKLDKDPKSAVHQQLANEKRVRGQMERVLASPELMARFMKEQYGIDVSVSRKEETTQTETEEAPVAPKKWTGKDFESLDDVAEKFNGLQDTFEKKLADKDKKIQDLSTQVNGIQNSGRMRQIADTTESEIKSLQAEPELTPNSPDFIPGLEQEIGNTYRELDYDEKTGFFRGNHSIKAIGARLIRTARAAKKAGVQKGQTIVKDKTGGTIRTGTGSKTGENTDNLSPAQSIAKGVQRMFK